MVETTLPVPQQHGSEQWSRLTSDHTHGHAAIGPDNLRSTRLKSESGHARPPPCSPMICGHRISHTCHACHRGGLIKTRPLSVVCCRLFDNSTRVLCASCRRPWTGHVASRHVTSTSSLSARPLSTAWTA